MSFALHERLAADTIVIGDLPLCRVLLMNNRHFPWLILVPRREGLRELFDLTGGDYMTAMQEIRDTAETLGAATGAHKMNIAALGNAVAQLHVHIIARRQDDAAWPRPVWNAAPPETYGESDLRTIIDKIKTAMGFH